MENLVFNYDFSSQAHLSFNSMYPEIRSDTQRQQYRREFDLDLAEYKRLCAEMDDIGDQMNKLSRELDTLQEGSTKFQVSLRAELPQTVLVNPWQYSTASIQNT